MPKSLGIACGCVVLSHFHSLTLYVRFVVLFRRRVRYIQFVVVCCVLVLCSNSSTAQMIKQTHPHRHKRIHVNNLNDFVFAIESLDLLWHLEMSQWLLWLCRFDFSEGMLFVFPQSGTSLSLSLSLFLFSLLSYSSLSPFLSLPLSPPPPCSPPISLSSAHLLSYFFSYFCSLALYLTRSHPSDLLCIPDRKIYQDQPWNSNDRDDLLIFCKMSHFISIT